jgi:excisionase family DNA binding protein
MQDEVLLTPREAARMLRVTRQTVYSYVVSGRLAAVKLTPGTLRVRQADIDRLLADGATMKEHVT